ncbi:MAG TPA: hypothetical protein PLS79_23255 [Caldilinea sp.]|nr:hypothetical protein [Caldilinea sp.]
MRIGVSSIEENSVQNNPFVRFTHAPMHLCDFSRGMLGAFGIAGDGIPIAADAALSALVRGAQQVAVSFFWRRRYQREYLPQDAQYGLTLEVAGALCDRK